MRNRIGMVALALCVAVLVGCPDFASDTTVYVDENCNLVYTDGSSANPLAVDPGDKVKFVNRTGDKVVIDFGTNQLFNTKKVTLPAGKSAVRTVRSGAAGYEGDFSLTCGDGSGNPKVVVGDDDGGDG